MMFKTNKILPVFAMLASTTFFMSPAQAVDIKQDQINKCVNGVVDNKIADTANANKLCRCQVNVRSKMTIGQTWEIESYAQSNKDPSQLPYVKKMQQELQQCTKDIKFNLPNKAG